MLSTFLDDNEKPGEALVPGFRDSGSVGGAIRARSTSQWARDDSGAAGERAGAPDDVIEVSAAWREALSVAASGTRELSKEGAPVPHPTGALRETLLGALRLAREEGTPGAHQRHLARALLNTPESRALEVLALALHRVDLDAQAEAVSGGAKPWESEADACSAA